MSCPYCGEELPEDAVYCPYCGSELSRETEYSERVITKYTQLINGEVFDIGPIPLEQALRELRALPPSYTTENGIALPLLGFQDEEGAFIEFLNEGEEGIFVRVEGYHGEDFMDYFTLKDAMEILKNFYLGKKLL